MLWINPIASTLLLLSLSLYIKEDKKSAYTMLFTYFLMSVLLYANILYYREFSDFMTVSSITGNVGKGVGSNFSFALVTSSLAMAKMTDFIYWIDFLLLAYLMRKNLQTKPARKKAFQKRYALAASLSAIAFLFGNLMLAETDRPQLLTRTFDRNYIVKYLGINFYTGYDAAQTVRTNHYRAQADENDLEDVYEFSRGNYAQPNEEFYGLAEGRNVFTILLESTQEFILDYEMMDEDGEMHEVTPFINSLYHDEGTIRFDNFFHQTGQGKTSDSGMLTENSLFGLPEGSAYQQLGGNNVFHSAPKILGEDKGYSSAVFHGNIGSFWNRNNTYENLGFDYFFDSNYYNMDEERTLDYGLKDKLFFKESTEYIEQLPQPFYTKFITLTNHFPYPLGEENATIPKGTSGDNTVNSYFQTMRYTDEALEEFFHWLKETGLYENSMVVLFGDHYGISNMRNPELAPLLGKDAEDWDAYDNTQLQRVPLMYHIPGYEEGKTYETYGGQVDYLPTLLHLLGVNTEPYLFMGQDLLSEENEELVPLRNGNVLTPTYQMIGSSVYDSKTGEDLTESLTEEERSAFDEKVNHARERLHNSDELLSLDLLRFYEPSVLAEWEANDYNYLSQLPHLKNHPNRSESLIERLEVETTTDLYQTNAPELMIEEDEVNELEAEVWLD
ncbi:MAG: LTA synthase family protein [Atopostipes suicloacalis]|nr:LTA synthase family protein [Atopostipes suicloacalis]